MSAAAMAGCSARSTPGAAKRGVAVDLTGVDMNPWSAAASTEATAPGRPIHWVTANAFDYRPEGGIDLIVSSQFTHHLDDDSLVHFLAWMEKTAKARLVRQRPAPPLAALSVFPHLVPPRRLASLRPE